MKYRAVLIAVGLTVFAGCGPQVREAVEGPACPGKKTIKEAAAALALQRQNLQAFTATADGVISWRDEEGKDRDEPVRGGNLAFVPPDKVFFKGEVVFKEARFGTNETEFWLRIKSELDTYWWGTRQLAQDCTGTLIFDPAAIAEAIGIVNVTPEWQMFNRDGYDILSLHEGEIIRKRVYVNACDYRVELIEYFSDEGTKQVSIELSDYTASDEGIMIPSSIRATSYSVEGLEQSAVSFKFKNVRALPMERQKPKLFERPGRDGYGKVLRLNEQCEFVEE